MIAILKSDGNGGDRAQMVSFQLPYYCYLYPEKRGMLQCCRVMCQGWLCVKVEGKWAHSWKKRMKQHRQKFGAKSSTNPSYLMVEAVLLCWTNYSCFNVLLKRLQDQSVLVLNLLLQAFKECFALTEAKNQHGLLEKQHRRTCSVCVFFPLSEGCSLQCRMAFGNSIVYRNH